ncbi:BgTH12-01337 [Blumeria graminis f. sp. triticale]|uniref:Bgt-684 n=3 Tax=Blumeria graminis TaxID=34373 RepID=A0A061HJX2_BLUGR|nr:hypothetical protein BGT96224_684 [Blumeria graminis f. sp. tritici 96224]CAD6505850.1 BgTH12-01337 [Blumeria graminis f. sp. triticale]VDB94022.1 Bgt-684 [Blumeria graminis f. sp. tritici]
MAPTLTIANLHLLATQEFNSSYPPRGESQQSLRQSLKIRQFQPAGPAQSIVPASYSDSDTGLEPGEVVGIVIGSVAAVLLLCWLFNSLLNHNSKRSIRHSTLAAGSRRHKHRRGRKRSHRRTVKKKSRTHRSSEVHSRSAPMASLDYTTPSRPPMTPPLVYSGAPRRMMIEESDLHNSLSLPNDEIHVLEELTSSSDEISVFEEPPSPRQKETGSTHIYE